MAVAPLDSTGLSGSLKPNLAATLAEMRTRMGADLVWFGRVGEVPSASDAHRLWWSGIWSDGHKAAADMLQPLDDRPVSRSACLDLSVRPLTWQMTIWRPDAKAFWPHAFARNVYVRHDLHEEHRLVVKDETGVVGVLAAAWDRRRTGVAARLSRALRDGHARWAHDRLRHAIRHQVATDAPPAGHIVLASTGAVQLASPPAHRWLDQDRAARLLGAVERATCADQMAATAIAAAGAEVRLTPLHGPLGSGWLGELLPLTSPHVDPRLVLTPAQAAVIAQVLMGSTAPEIAKDLNKSVETVRSQIKQAYGRLGVVNRLELARAMRDPPQ